MVPFIGQFQSWCITQGWVSIWWTPHWYYSQKILFCGCLYLWYFCSCIYSWARLNVNMGCIYWKYIYWGKTLAKFISYQGLILVIGKVKFLFSTNHYILFSLLYFYSMRALLIILELRYSSLTIFNTIFWCGFEFR